MDATPGRRWVRWTLIGLSAVLLAVAGTGYYLYQRFDGNITSDDATARELLRYEKERPKPAVHGAQNILLIGSDDRGSGNSKYGKDTGIQRSDTTILLHIAADRKSTTAVSLPRDLMVEIPSCRRPNGERSGHQFNQFNFAFAYGGASCTIRVVEKLTGIRVDHHMILDFKGFKEMVDAVDGVEVCLPEAVRDKSAKLKLKAGRQVLHGEQALGYVRARKSIGNGSDTDRMQRQQEFLASLVNKVQSNGVLLNPLRLAPLLDAATSSITTDPGLSSLGSLYDLVRSLREVPGDKVGFLTVPRTPYRYDTNRDELVQPDASRLFAALRKDKAVPVEDEDEDEAKVNTQTDEPTGSTPTYEGTKPTDPICQ